MYKQIIEENKGLKKDDFLPGFAYCDGVRFDLQDEVNLMMEPMANLLTEIIEEKNINSILDVGSGSGALAFFLRQKNPSLSVVTIDGNCDIVESPYLKRGNHIVARTDKEYQIVDESGKKVEFDLIVCFEHIEHIQEENFDQFLENVINHSHKKTIFFATAAKWEYENEEEKHIHCNVKQLDGWGKYFDNFVSKSEDQDKKRMNIAAIDPMDMTSLIVNKKISIDQMNELFSHPLTKYLMRFFDYFCLQPGSNFDINLRKYTTTKRREIENWMHRGSSSVVFYSDGFIDMSEK